jgi:MraZ protein
VFLGEYLTKFTGLGRIVLPKKFRDNLSGGNEIVLTRGFEGCVWGYSKLGFEELAQKQLEFSATGQRARYLRRYLFSGSISVELDSQGRFVIPSALLIFANLSTDIVIIGAGDHFEVWNEKAWRKHLKVIEEEYGHSS